MLEPADFQHALTQLATLNRKLSVLADTLDHIATLGNSIKEHSVSIGWVSLRLPGLASAAGS